MCPLLSRQPKPFVALAMRIAFLNHPWSRLAIPVQKADSVAIWTYEVARRLARDHEVVVYGRRFPGQPEAETHEGVLYRRMAIRKPFTSLQNLVVRMGITPVSSGSMLTHAAYAFQAAAQLRQEGHDVVHVHNLSHFVPTIRAMNPKLPIVLHMHCEWMSQIDQRTARSRLQSVSRLLGCSTHVASLVQNRFPQLASRCAVLHNGVDLGTFGAEAIASDPPRDGGVILFVGRITPEKAIHDLLDAFQLVLKQRPQAELRLIGPYEPTPPEYIVRLSRDAYVQDLARFYPGHYLDTLKRSTPPEVLRRVRFIGELDRASIVDEFRQAHVLANPSVSESFGMSLVEAMASGVPVVATRVGGMRNVVQDGETGLLVPAANPQELSDALLRVLSDEFLRRTLIEQARVSVRRFSWDAVATAANDHYAALAEAG
jgi:glycosyltransferase involved in cell wall biosynthesis